MKVDSLQLKKAIFGAVQLWEQDGWLNMCRFTKAQLEYFSDSERYRVRAKASSGMTLEFFTDSRTFSLDYQTFQASSKDMSYIDIYIDDVMKLHCGKDGVEKDEGSISMDLGAGTKKVAVYFPCLFGTRIANVEIQEGAFFSPVEKDRTILFLGDSITQGYVTRFPSLTYANVLTRRFQARALNQAIGGAEFCGKDLDENLDYQPDMIFVAYGTNDWSHGVNPGKTSSAYLKKLVSIYPESAIYVILPIWRTNACEKNEAGMTFDEAREAIAEACRAYENIRIIDSIDFVPHYKDFYWDNVHPNALGFARYAEGLEKAVRELEEER